MRPIDIKVLGHHQALHQLFVLTLISCRNLVGKVLMPLCLLVTLTGCIKFGPKEEDAYFQIGLITDLNAPHIATLPTSLKQLTIDPVHGPGIYNATQVVAQIGPYDYTYTKDVRWIDTLPLLIQETLIQAFQDSGKIVGVGPSQMGLSPQYILMPTLRAFEVRVDIPKKPSALITLAIQLFEVKTRSVVATHVFTQQAIITKEGLAPTALAFNAAWSSIANAIITWTLHQPGLK